MNRYRYRFNFIQFLLPVIGLISSVIVPALSLFRRSPRTAQTPVEPLSEAEAEVIAGQAVQRAEQAEKVVARVRTAEKGERRGGIGRWILPAMFILAVRWLLTPPRRAGGTLFSAQAGRSETPTETRERQPARPQPRRTAIEPTQTGTTISGLASTVTTRVHQFDYPTARQETRQAGAPREAASGEPDDLKVIEGIGPAIARHLNNRGIRTFHDLAGTEVNVLEDILSDEGIRQLSNPHTWPEQARLAAQGQWDELRRYQQQLKAGRET